MRKDLPGEEILFHFIRERRITSLFETEINQEKDQPLHKVELGESCPAASSETNSFNKKRPRQFSESHFLMK